MTRHARSAAVSTSRNHQDGGRRGEKTLLDRCRAGRCGRNNRAISPSRIERPGHKLPREYRPQIDFRARTSSDPARTCRGRVRVHDHPNPRTRAPICCCHSTAEERERASLLAPKGLERRRQRCYGPCSDLRKPGTTAIAMVEIQMERRRTQHRLKTERGGKVLLRRAGDERAASAKRATTSRCASSCDGRLRMVRGRKCLATIWEGGYGTRRAPTVVASGKAGKTRWLGTDAPTRARGPVAMKPGHPLGGERGQKKLGWRPPRPNPSAAKGIAGHEDTSLK